jgi:hypothetical protein
MELPAMVAVCFSEYELTERPIVGGDGLLVASMRALPRRVIVRERPPGRCHPSTMPTSPFDVKPTSAE